MGGRRVEPPDRVSYLQRQESGGSLLLYVWKWLTDLDSSFERRMRGRTFVIVWFVSHLSLQCGRKGARGCLGRVRCIVGVSRFTPALLVYGLSCVRGFIVSAGS